MASIPLFTFNPFNRRLLLLLAASHLLWSAMLFLLAKSCRLFMAPPLWVSGAFIILQLFAAAQLLLPALLLHPERRHRSFYLFWGGSLTLIVWLVNQIPAIGDWGLLLSAIKSGLLLLVATVTAAALARYLHRLGEIIPICLVMTLADFVSWLYGPTASFTRQIEEYRLSPEGPPPLVDMILIKFAIPGTANLSPLFGLSDWIMVAFFAITARRFGINDNLIGATGESLAQQGRPGRYLPVPVAGLGLAIIMAQGSGLFIPALPMIALIIFLWYSGRYLWLRRQSR